MPEADLRACECACATRKDQNERERERDYCSRLSKSPSVRQHSLPKPSVMRSSGVSVPLTAITTEFTLCKTTIKYAALHFPWKRDIEDIIFLKWKTIFLFWIRKMTRQYLRNNNIHNLFLPKKKIQNKTCFSTHGFTWFTIFKKKAWQTFEGCRGIVAWKSLLC